jgi:hypothetical protein
MTATAAGRPVLGSLPGPVLDAVRDVALAAPDRLALVAGRESLSYGDLWQQVQETARSLGHRPGVVAVPATHEPGTVVAGRTFFRTGDLVRESADIAPSANRARSSSRSRRDHRARSCLSRRVR